MVTPIIFTCISKRNTLCSVSPGSPCVLDVPGTYNVNSSSGCVCPGSFRPEVKGVHSMRLEGKGLRSMRSDG